MIKAAPSNTITHTLSQQDKEELIRKYPLFCLLDSNDVLALALLAQEITIDSDTVIVAEGDVVDSVYLIHSGNAKVSKSVASIEKNEVLTIASLNPFDSIGLNETGLYSQTGLRSATVTSHSPMVLLRIDIQTFNNFLQKSTVHYPALKNIGEIILLMLNLKENALFQQLSDEKIRLLAHRATRITITPGEVLFNEGDLGDAYYLLVSGQINLFTTENNERIIIKQLDAPALFGEATLIENEHRNASADAKTTCSLIRIDKADILEIIRTNPDAAEALALARIEQIRPRKNANILIQEQPDGKFKLGHKLSKKAVVLSAQEFAIWDALDGHTPLMNIKKKYNKLTLKEIYDFVRSMHHKGFLMQQENHRVHSTFGLKNTLSNLVNKIKTFWRG